ncbi:MAG TPA: hypothetical protein VGW78_04560 [Candidatus Babeliales bacterium]|jgi:hypothetical protein|nr:hypothetical protein [Candidatus Babeliales bacterium]
MKTYSYYSTAWLLFGLCVHVNAMQLNQSIDKKMTIIAGSLGLFAGISLTWFAMKKYYNLNKSNREIEDLKVHLKTEQETNVDKQILFYERGCQEANKKINEQLGQYKPKNKSILAAIYKQNPTYNNLEIANCLMKKAAENSLIQILSSSMSDTLHCYSCTLEDKE